MKTLFGLIVGMWSSLAVADERSLTIKPGREFSADSYVHKPLTNDAPLDAQSRSYVANLQRQIKKYFGHPDVNIDGVTPAIYIVPMDQPTVRVKYVAWDRPGETVRPLQAQWETVPLPDDLQPSTGDDGEAVVYQPSTGKMWEFWRVRRTGAKVVNSAGKSVDEWGANWGGRMDNIATNPGDWVTAGTDEAGHTFQLEAGRVFQSEAGHPWRQSHGSI